LRLAGGLLFEQLVHVRRTWVVPRRGVPASDRQRPLVIVQHGQIAHALCRRFDDRLQQVLPVHGHALDARRIEQVGRVDQRGAEPLWVLDTVQAQVELRTGHGPLHLRHIQPRQLHAVTDSALAHLIVEHHLEQWTVAQAALRLQGFDQLFEGQILVSLGFQCSLAHLLEQVEEACLAIDVRAQHLRVDEKAQQALGLGAIAVGRRHADTDVSLAAVAMQQQLERGQQHHERCASLGLGQLPDALQQRGWKLENFP